MPFSIKSRREFLKQTAVAASGITIVPSHVVSGLGYKAPSDKLNIVGIGVGGKGFNNLKAMATENVVGLCDVDWKYAERCFREFPAAKRYYDWRRMFDEMSGSFDAVMIATADHTHAVVAAAALVRDKHVYCQKPLAHSVYESRLLTKLAAKHNVATQMGNQGNSGHGVRQLCEWLWNGEIGEVREVHAWTDRPIWPQGLQRPEEPMAVPDTLNWDLFVGPAPMRPFHELYTPWNWRGWWDFGTGAFGDMACHVLDPVYQALKLGFPEKILGSSTTINTESAPQAETVSFSFPGRAGLPGVGMPPVTVHWYDGGLLPNRPDLIPEGEDLMSDGLGGCIFVGSKDTLLCDCGGFRSRLLSGRVPELSPYLRRVPGATGYLDGPHEQDWIRAAKEPPGSRVLPSSDFSYAGPFNEMVLLGVLAIRLQGLHKALTWDAAQMKFTNLSEADTLKVMTSSGFKMVGGRPSFNNQYQDFNAIERAEEFVRHTYRDGWELPEMPG